MARRKQIVIGNPSVLKRGIAMVADLLFINVLLAFPLKSLIESSFPSGSVMDTMRAVQASERMMGLGLLIMLSISALAFLYMVLFEWKLSQTPGMMLMKLRAESIEGELSFGQCLMRNLFIFPFFPFYLLWIIEPFYMFLKGGARLTEKASGTRVVEEMSLAKARN